MAKRALSEVHRFQPSFSRCDGRMGVIYFLVASRAVAAAKHPSYYLKLVVTLLNFFVGCLGRRLEGD